MGDNEGSLETMGREEEKQKGWRKKAGKVEDFTKMQVWAKSWSEILKRLMVQDG